MTAFMHITRSCLQNVRTVLKILIDPDELVVINGWPLNHPQNSAQYPNVTNQYV